jgi:DNA-binding transcriptional LysR family regulator
MPKNIDPDLLRTFLSICETKKFGETAERVGRTQAAVSLQIKRLEDLLGKSLFIRNNRSVALSDAGEILQPYAKKMIELNDETFLRVSEMEISGVIRLGAPEAITSTHLPNILSEYNKKHPSIVLDVTCKLTDELLNDFDNNLYDVVILKKEASERKDGDIIYRERLAWVKEKGRTLDFKRSIPMVLSPHPCIYRRLALEALEKKRVNYRAVMTAHSLSGRLSAVRKGLGVSLLPEDTITDDPSVERAAALPPINDLVMTILNNKVNKNEFAQNFIEHTLDYFKNL